MSFFVGPARKWLLFVSFCAFVSLPAPAPALGKLLTSSRADLSPRANLEIRRRVRARPSAERERGALTWAGSCGFLAIAAASVWRL